MLDTTSLISQVSLALTTALQAALPAIAFVAVGSIVVSILQSFTGVADPAIGLAGRIAGVTAALVLFGSWSASLIVAYWASAWQALGRVMAAGP